MAEVITISGDNLTASVSEDSIKITQRADGNFIAELTIFDEDSDIDIVAGSYLLADIITIVDGGTTYFSGFVANVDKESLEDGSRKLYLQCQGYGILLNVWIIAFSQFDDTDQNIIDAIITAAETAGMPAINSDPVGGGGFVDEIDADLQILFENMTLQECLEAIGNLTGGRFYVDNDRALHYFTDEGIDAGFALSDDPDQIDSFSYFDTTIMREDSSRIVNSVRVVGKGGYSIVIDDAGSQATYGMHSYVLKDDSLETEDARRIAGEAYIAANKNPQISFSVKTYKAGAEAGQEINYENDIFDVDETFPIRELYITWVTGTPVYELLLETVDLVVYHRDIGYRPTGPVQPYTVEDGLILFGQPPNLRRVAGVPQWQSTDGELGILEGGLHPVAGPWPGSVGYMFELANENFFHNPVFGHGTWDNGWSETGGSPPTAIEETSFVRFGKSAAKVTFAGANSVFAENMTADKAAFDGNELTISGWVKTTAPDIRVIMQADNSTGTGSSDVHPGDGKWHRLSATLDVTFDDGGATTFIIVGVIGNTNALIAYVDGFQLEVTDHATSLAVGDMGDGYSWGGAIHDSNSLRVKSYMHLDDHVELISDRDTLSFRAVAQAQYDADATWPGVYGYIMFAYKDANEQISLIYDTSEDKFKLYINAAFLASESSVQTFVAGDWLDIIWTLDFANNVYKLYVNGILEFTDETSLTAPELTRWEVPYNTAPGGWAFAEYAAFSIVLEALTVYSLYNNSPLVDPAAKSAPPILLTSQSGDRLEITAEELAIWEDGIKTIWLDEDGLSFQEDDDDDKNKIKWWDDNDEIIAQLYGWVSAGDNSSLRLSTQNPPTAADRSVAFIAARPHTDFANSDASFELYSKATALGGSCEMWPAGARVLQVLSSGVKLFDDLVFVPDAAGEGYLGTASLYWKEVNYKTLTDRGCLLFLGVDLKRVDSEDTLTALESIKAIVPSDKVSPRTGKFQLDYRSFPDICYSPAPIATEDVYEDAKVDKAGIVTEPKKLQYKTGDKMGEDGIEMGTLVSVLMDAIKELSAKNDALEARIVALENPK